MTSALDTVDSAVKLADLLVRRRVEDESNRSESEYGFTEKPSCTEDVDI